MTGYQGEGVMGGAGPRPRRLEPRLQQREADRRRLGRGGRERDGTPRERAAGSGGEFDVEDAVGGDGVADDRLTG